MKRFKDLATLIAKAIKVRDAILDGEIVALDNSGMPAFYDLMKRECQAVYFAFDILWLNGRDLRELPLAERKKILRSVIPRKSECVGYVSFIDRRATKLFELIKERDLEGLVVKQKDGKYKPDRTLWYKVLNPGYYAESRAARVFPKTSVSFPESIGRTADWRNKLPVR